MDLTKENLVNSFLDFKLLFERWESLADNNHPSICLYHDYLSRIKKFPELLESNIDPLVLKTDQNKLGFGLILSSLIPLSGQDDKILAISKPFDYNPIYATPAFSEQFLQENGLIKLPENLDYERISFDKMIHVYAKILSQLYGIQMNQFPPMVFKFRGANGVNRHYQIHFNTQFVHVVPKVPLPQIHDRSEFCKIDEPYQFELDRLKKLLPLDLFEFHGFVIMEANDLTVAQSVATLNEAVLKQDEVSSEEFMGIVEDSVKSLLDRGELKVGLAVLQNISGRIIMSESRLAYSYLIRQLLISGSEEPYHAIIEFLSKVNHPVFLKDIQDNPDDLPLINLIIGMGLQEIILYPLRHNGNLVGVLEICSFEKETFDPLMLHTLDHLAPSLSLALHRQAENLDYKIKAIIRKNFTAIHPVVEWKFDEIALDYVLDEESGKKPEIKPILFKEVYPLYAAVDIKNSSVERNQAIHDDFVIQLDMGKAILELAGSLHYLPLLESLMDQIEEYKRRINLILLSEEEVRITEFFYRELEPTFIHLSETYQDLKPKVQAYFDALDPQLQIINHHRKAFERSLQLINQTIGAFLDEEEIKVQKIFPHYFEKFKTDGLEYNIYIGQSLVKDQKFDMIYLKNLRLWQLQSLIAIVNLIEDKKPELENPLETTQLILAHSTPISISFRLDERKFDVEGAYNIRYEIMKKRIDKALISGTQERLVQPGKIAIVYSQQREVKEYLDFITYLQNKGQLQDQVEELELEEMQGVHGLKAIRVTVTPKTLPSIDSSSKLISEGKKG
ncbi:GAF domain-containing protein [Algoriphagus sp. D3-2-R+10]|uniref:GAF domain-containing protein n=1 Tax=Algoriphagus aurantiacus TaxID=3103948 RepID=UPI002B37B285|nr:GAF domain-containing protein [Algoriphagus sp. D3-2-R+10]MEB2774066.1 GAF domain-containing protein [Algoriphagus sp. D3-2-R+10]